MGTDTGGRYVMPTAAQMQEMFDRWDALVPNSGIRLRLCLGFAERRCGARKFASAPERLPATQYERRRGRNADRRHRLSNPTSLRLSTRAVARRRMMHGREHAAGCRRGWRHVAGRRLAGGTTTDPAPVDPTPVSHGGGVWHNGPNSGFGQGIGVGHGLDFSKLLEGGSSPSFIPPRNRTVAATGSPGVDGSKLVGTPGSPGMGPGEVKGPTRRLMPIPGQASARTGVLLNRHCSMRSANTVCITINSRGIGEFQKPLL